MLKRTIGMIINLVLWIFIIGIWFASKRWDVIYQDIFQALFFIVGFINAVNMIEWSVRMFIDKK